MTMTLKDPGKVFKGKKMAGRMGGKKRWQYNLTVAEIVPEHNLLYVKGCVPGNIFISIRSMNGLILQ
jgi:large subunit ribosomal protein L3